MNLKTRFDGTEWNPVAMMHKIAESGKHDYSVSILSKCLIGFGPYDGETFIRIVDHLGLWNNRAHMLYMAAGCKTYEDFAKLVIDLHAGLRTGRFEQNDIIKCKSEDDFKEFLEKFPIQEEES